MSIDEGLGEVVGRVAGAVSFAEAAACLLDWAQDLTGCEAAMLRLVEPSGERTSWIPALIHRGLSPRFLQDEGLIGAEECLCGRVCAGLGDPTLPFFTQGGSFLWGRVQSLTEEFLPEALGDVRGRCIVEGYDSLAIIPLRGKDGEPVGALHLADHGNHRFADRVDLLEAAGRACGPLLLRHESRELELIAALEAALRPRGLPPIPGVEFALAFSSATDSATVGGDFYDLRELAPGEVLVLVGDYCGNGVEAAGIAARIRYTLSGLAQTQPDPALLLTEAERLLGKTLPPEGFVTLLVCRLSADGRLTASAAGHPWPLRLSPEGGGKEVRLRGCPPVGTNADKTFANTEVALPPGWALLLYTDGISDARREGVFFGVAGIVRTWRRTGDRGLAAFVQSLRAEAEGFHADPTSRDDRLAVALRWTRAGAEGAGHRHASPGWPGDRDEEGGSKDHVA